MSFHYRYFATCVSCAIESVELRNSENNRMCNREHICRAIRNLVWTIQIQSGISVAILTCTYICYVLYIIPIRYTCMSVVCFIERSHQEPIWPRSTTLSSPNHYRTISHTYLSSYSKKNFSNSRTQNYVELPRALFRVLWSSTALAHHNRNIRANLRAPFNRICINIYNSNQRRDGGGGMNTLTRSKHDVYVAWCTHIECRRTSAPGFLRACVRSTWCAHARDHIQHRSHHTHTHTPNHVNKWGVFCG